MCMVHMCQDWTIHVLKSLFEEGRLTGEIVRNPVKKRNAVVDWPSPYPHVDVVLYLLCFPVCNASL
jgi:hypothetical protein